MPSTPSTREPPLREPDPAAETPGGAAPGDEPWSTTRVSKTLWPPQAGTHRLRERYGAALVCVRYRHDAAGRYRYTTVEVMIAHGPVRTPRGGKVLYTLDPVFVADHQRPALLRRGARWDRTDRVWRLSLSTAKALGLEGHIRRVRAL